MPPLNVVVDGSNIATEGRSLPSLAQLDEAVQAFLAEFPGAQVTVVVDATFGHRIEDDEREAFRQAEAAGEVVSPPAGAIGRGDAFLLRIAEKIGAMVLSNDSFQEFHGEHDWLFEDDRLIGGKPVPGIGWIFTPRSPVRGPKSRVAVKAAKRGRGGAGSEAEVTRPKGRDRSKEPKPRRKKAVDAAIVEATEEAVEPEIKGRKRTRRRSGGPPAEPVNPPLEFLEFVAAHPLGSTVTGEVDSFSSHGCFVDVGGVRCYLPLSGMGDPPPRSAREVLSRGEQAELVVQAFDPPRRGVELALPAFAHPAGAPTPETVEAEITGDPEVEPTPRKRPVLAKKAAATKKAPTKKAAPAKKAAAATKKTTATKTAAAPAKKATATKKKAAATKKTTAKKTTAKKTPAKKTPAKKTAAPKKVTTKKAAAKKAATTKKAAPAKKAPAKRSSSR